MKALALFFKILMRIFSLKAWRWEQITLGIVQIGIGSLPIIIISTAFAGMVITHEMAWHMDTAPHTVTMIPGITGQFVLRELAVAIPALLLVAKAGAGMTAEIGTMKVTEQIDALRLLQIDPIDYLVFPRFISSIISSACLTLISMGVTTACALAVAVIGYHFSALEYLNALRHFVSPTDLFCGLIKGMVYGAVIPIICCHYGLHCRQGAEGVGSATTQSVVTSTCVVILLDFLLTYLFKLVL